MVTIGTGRDDPRKWVKAAYLLLGAIETDPQDKLPTRSEVAAKLDCHEKSVLRAYRELERMGLIHRIGGHGYFPGAGR